MTIVMEIFLLLVIFQIKHWLADYRLQTYWMVQGKGAEKDWVDPLAAHAGIHAGLTFAIASVFLLLCNPGYVLCAAGLAVMDFWIHFGVDRLKASPRTFGSIPMSSPLFWQILGADQALHHLTHYLIIAILILSS